MEKFKNKEEQAEWFLRIYRRDDIKLIDKLNILLERDCGNFEEFLHNNILPTSKSAYLTFTRLNTPISSIKELKNYGSMDMFNRVLRKYFTYLGGSCHKEDSLYAFELSTTTRNALLRYGLKTKSEVVNYIKDNGGTSESLKQIRCIGKVESIRVCKALDIEEYIKNNEKPVSDIKRFNTVKKYLENGGTDIEEIKRLVGV